MRLVALLLVVACGRVAPATAVPPPQRTAYCGTSCWNSAYCYGQGFACDRCVGGVCTGSALFGAAEASPLELTAR